jgi:DNA-binding SARP family transcriptional activator
MLWPHSGDAAARSNLRVLIHRLHRAVGQVVLAPGEALKWGDVLAVDTEDSDEQLLRRCVELGPGACRLLGELEYDDLDDLGVWLTGARARLEHRLLAAHERALAESEASGDLLHAVRLAESLVHLCPLSERPYRELMRLHSARGDRAAGLAAYERCRNVLRDQLGVSPAEQTVAMHRQLLHLQAPGGPAARPSGSGSMNADKLVARVEECARLSAAWRDRRPVLVSGECGIGKTRLLKDFLDGRPAVYSSISATDGDRRYGALARFVRDLRLAGRVADDGEKFESASVLIEELAHTTSAASVTREQALQEKLRGCLESLRQQGVNLVLVDDVHHADEPSQAALCWFLESLISDNAGVCVGLAYRCGALARGAAKLYERLAAAGQVTCIELKGLTRAGVAELLASLPKAGGSFREHGDEIHRLTGGNPRFVLELARTSSQSAPGDFTAGMHAIKTMLQSRLRCCSDAAMALARVASMAGEAFSCELAIAVMRMPAVELMHPWGELQRVGLFDGNGPAHELAMEAVRDTVPDGLRRSLQAEIVAQLEKHRNTRFPLRAGAGRACRTSVGRSHGFARTDGVATLLRGSECAACTADEFISAAASNPCADSRPGLGSCSEGK